MSVVDILERLSGPARTQVHTPADRLVVRSGKYGAWVRQHYLVSAAALGAALLVIAMLPLDGVTRPSDGPDPLLVTPGDRARIDPALRACLDVHGHFNAECPALASTGRTQP